MTSRVQGKDIAELVGSRVEGVKEYAPEPLQATAARLGLPVEKLVKLDANENPYGPTERTQAALQEFSYAHRYPDPVCRELRRHLADYVGVDAGQILVGNGSDELIDLILKLFRPDAQGRGVGSVINCPPTFGMYQFYATTNDMQVEIIARGKDFDLNVEAIEAACQAGGETKLIFLTSPNNPDGKLLPAETLKRLLDCDLVVVLDEAYIEFGGTSRATWVPQYDNLIVLRTFSKWAGMAGLRIGYGVFPRALMPYLWRLKSPYNVNGYAQAGAIATLGDLPSAQERIQRLIDERERLFSLLREVSYLEPFPSQANFLLCRVLPGMSVDRLQAGVEAKGVLLRYFDRPGLEGYIRISVGTPEETDVLLDTLRVLED